MLELFAQKFVKIAAKVNPISPWIGVLSAASFISSLFAAWSKNWYSNFIASHSFIIFLLMMWTGWCWFIWFIYFPRKLELVGNEFKPVSEYEKLPPKLQKFHTRNYVLCLGVLILFSIFDLLLAIKDLQTSQ